MKVTILKEPELEFGGGMRHIDPRFGLMTFGPVDAARAASPKQIRIGIVGAAANVDKLLVWLERCRSEIPAKQPSSQPHLFPMFPGFGIESPFGSELVWDARSLATLSDRQIKSVVEAPPSQRVSSAVDLMLSGLESIKDTSSIHVVLVALSGELAEVLLSTANRAPGEDDGTEEERFAGADFHDLFKARAMRAVRCPIQIILPHTYGEKFKRKNRRHKETEKRVQDEATRAWNLHAALYYKAGGSPWRLAREPEDLLTCFVGVSFYRSLDEETVQTSVAQVFNERGHGIVVRGGTARISKVDRMPHLSAADARTLMADALKKFHSEHKTMPARVVVHKSSRFDENETSGFRAGACEDSRVEFLDLVSIGNSPIRLFRTGRYPTLRGTLWELDDRCILYTRGAVPFFETYPGMYVPRPLRFQLDCADASPAQTASEILALTKMNWNNTQFDGGWPITLRAARKVGRILKYVEGEPQAQYAHYM